MTATTTGTTPAAGVIVNVSLNLDLPRIEREALTVRLTQVTGRAIAPPRSSVPVEPINLTDLDAGTGANCFLQLWEMDEYRVDTYRTNEETDRQALAANTLIASIPGIFVKRARNQYEFQLPQNFVRPAFNRALASANGFIRLKLRDAGDTDRILNLHMPRYEKFFELAATIRVVADDASFAAVTDQPPFQIRNEIASIRHQVAQRGGIALAISGNWRVDPSGITESTVTETVNGVTRTRKKYMKGTHEVCRRVLANGGGEVYFTSLNDAEFEGQAEEMMSVLPAFMPDADRTAKIGYQRFDQTGDGALTELAGLIRDTRLAVGHALAANEMFLDAAAQGLEDSNASAAAPPLAQCPRLATLMFLCHGFRNGMTIAGDENDPHHRQTRTGNIATWVPQVATHSVENLNIALYACNCGRGLFVGTVAGGADPSMGQMAPAEELGMDSFAWTLFHTLRTNGITEPSVWAHTTAAHTTRNPFLRVFCSAGAGDFVSIVKQQPRTDRFRGFINIFTTGDNWVHRGNILREVCTYHGAYLDWAWNAGQSVNAATGWFDASIAAEVALLLQEVREETSEVSATLPEQVLFEDDTRRVIIAPNGAAFAAGVTPDPQLTRLLRLSHFPLATSPFRLSVPLVKGIQLVCDRVTNNATAPIAEILEVRDEGESAIIRGTTSGNRPRLATKAADAVTQGFLTGSISLSDGRVLLSVRDGGPTTVSATP